MSSYSTYDFEESIKGIELKSIKSVLAAWGNVDSEGRCCDECGGEWTGGFLMELKDGTFAYVTGWCDYTGWGCQDGTDVTMFTSRPELSALAGPPESSWDHEPADLNNLLPQEDSDAG